MNWQYYSYVKIICELSAFLSEVTVLIRDLVEESASLKLSREITSCSAMFSRHPGAGGAPQRLGAQSVRRGDALDTYY